MLRRQDRLLEAGLRIEEAVALFERKANAASAARGRSLLAEIAIV